MTHFTPTQQRLLKVLSDGYCHRPSDLKECLDDELAGPTALQFHLSKLRQKLRPAGQDVIYQVLEGVGYYRHVRLMSASE